MIIIELDMKWRFLMKTKFLAGIIPKLMTVGGDFWRHDTIEDDAAIISKPGQYLLHNVFQPSPMSAYEDGVGARE